MRNGRLYQVFDAIESAYNWTSEEQSTFRFPDATGPLRIDLQRVKKVESRKTMTCTVYTWDAKRFLFAPGRTAPGTCK